MTEPRDPLTEAIRAAGEVPPPPDRKAAFARAMHPLLMPSRRRWNRSFVALLAAALLAVPAAVFAARATHTPTATIAPITAEKPDPGGSIQREADDSTLKRVSASITADQHARSTDERSGGTGNASADTEHSGDGTPATTTDGRDGSGSDSSSPSPGTGSDDLTSTPAPTPIPSPTMGSDGGSPISSPAPSDGSPGPN